MPSKILFVQSWLGPNQPHMAFPIAPATIAARLDERYEVQGFDPNIADNPIQDLSARLKEFAPDFVAVSLRNVDPTNIFERHIYYNGFRKTIDIIREGCPDATLVVGGSGYSLFPGQILDELPQLDFGIFLEGEESFPELLENINSPEKVKGIYYRKNGSVRFTGQRTSMISMENSPFPRWDIFDTRRYARIPFSFGIETKRGCSFECAYCSYFLLHGHKIRKKRPERVLEEIVELNRRFGIDHVSFIDSVFNVPLDHAMDILRLLKKNMPAVKWIGYVSERELTDEFAGLAIETGLRVFVCSADAYTDRCLELMGKGITVKDIDNAVSVIKRHPPAEIGFNFFLNGPGYTYRTLGALLWFLVKTKIRMKQRFKILRITYGYIRIEPGTPIEKVAINEGIISEKTNLLARSSEEYTRCFYINPRLKIFNSIMIPLNRLARRFKPVGLPPHP